MQDSKEIEIVTLVEQHPILWDTTLKDYKNKKKQEVIWEMLAAHLEMDVQDVEYRWVCIRRKFVRKSREGKSGSSAEENEDWPLLKYLQFLKKVVRHRRCITNEIQNHDYSQPSTSSANFSIKSEYIENLFETSPFETEVTTEENNTKRPAEEKIAPPQKKLKIKDVDKKLFSYLENSDIFSLKKYAEEDEDISFFKGTLSLIKKFSPQKKLRFKTRYLDLITEFINE